ncbi:MAG: ribosomal L7Ae/L30e/S12e/Gadd45 family protein [Clostridia bacterium]
MDAGIIGENLIVGARQSIKALKNGKALEVYIADDADESIKEEFISECMARNIKIIRYGTMKELGRDCGIDIGAAIACRIEK